MLSSTISFYSPSPGQTLTHEDTIHTDGDRSVKPSTKSKWHPDFMSTQHSQRMNLADVRRGTCRVEKQMYLFKQAESELVARDLYTASTVHIIQAKQNCVMGVIGGGDGEGWN